MIITIDGAAGTGKTTVAKQVADSLHFAYFDTGAMYRAVTWAILQKNISLDNTKFIGELLDSFTFIIKHEDSHKSYFVGNEEVTEAIRSVQVTSYVSAVAALPMVRQVLWKIQRRFAEREDAVFEGRDLGSVVFPDAEVKIFLTGRPEVRAERRFHEMMQKNPQEMEHFDINHMMGELVRRDKLDSTRELAPLICPEQAYVIDTSDLSLTEVVERILIYVRSRPYFV